MRIDGRRRLWVVSSFDLFDALRRHSFWTLSLIFLPEEAVKGIISQAVLDLSASVASTEEGEELRRHLGLVTAEICERVEYGPQDGVILGRKDEDGVWSYIFIMCQASGEARMEIRPEPLVNKSLH